MFLFYWPWLALLLFVPLILYYLLPANQKNINNSPKIIFPAITRLSNAFGMLKARESKSKLLFIVLFSLLWISLVLALMRPQLVEQMSFNEKEGYDIMLAVDISGSMEALDFSTTTNRITRLDVTKKVVSQFVLDRKGDRVGLILFGEYAYLQMPITFDIIAVSNMLNQAVTGMAGFSTAIGDAIGVAVKEIKSKPEKSRIIILLTDGTDNASNIPPLEAARIAKHYNIRIYTIGIGVGNGHQVPYLNPDGSVSMTEIIMDEDMLQEVAEITGGQYFKATDNKTLHKIYNKINELEKTKIEVMEYSIRKSLYKYPLGIACFLFLILCILPLIRENRYAI